MKKLLPYVVVFFITVQYSFGQTISYTSDVKPLFDKYGCTNCHGGNGGLFVSPYANLFTTGNHTPVVVAGDTNSVLVKKIKGIAGFGSQMPLGGPVMTASDLNTIMQWINNGAPETTTSVKELADVVSVHSFNLSQNYPNPFNPTTTIEFTLAEDSKVSLKIYDVLGKEAATLVDGEFKAGVVHQVTFNASKFSSGIYFYRLDTGKNNLVKKLMVLK
jgi:hypothetical protein